MEATAMMHGRRAFMITGAAAADGGAGGGAVWAAERPIRYPDPNIKVLDPRFQQYVLGNAAIERLAGGCRFTEGPVWFGDGRYLLWSDIPNDRILKWGRCLKGVDSRSKGAPEFVAIDKQPNDKIVHALRLGEAQCATH
jgi:hypothetical protein